MVYSTLQVITEDHVVTFVSKLYIFIIYLYYRPFYRKPEIPVNAHFVYRGGQRFANFYCTSFKTNICVDTEGALYHRKMCNMS